MKTRLNNVFLPVHCSQFSTVLFSIVAPDSGSKIFLNNVDNHESSNILFSLVYTAGSKVKILRCVEGTINNSEDPCLNKLFSF